MSYHPKKSTIIARPIPRMGLGIGPADCGPGQTFYPGLYPAGYPSYAGQCSTPALAQSQLASGVAGGNMNNPGGAPGSGDGGFVSSLLSAFKPPASGAPMMPPGYNPYASQGMSSGTMIAIGVGAVGLLAVVLIASK